MKSLAEAVNTHVQQQHETAIADAQSALIAALNQFGALHPEAAVDLAVVNNALNGYAQVMDMLRRMVLELHRRNNALTAERDNALREYADLEDAIISRDDDHHLVGDLIAETKEDLASDFGYDDEFTDYVLSNLADRMAATLGVDNRTAYKFLELLMDEHRYLPDQVADPITEALEEWKVSGHG